MSGKALHDIVATFCLALLALTLGCSKSVESLVASGDAALGRGDYPTASIQLKSALQQDANNTRAWWLLGELSLAVERGDDAEKAIRRAQELGVGNDAVIPALAQALLLQGRVGEVLEFEQPSGLSPRSRGELTAAKGLAKLAQGDSQGADALTTEGVKLAAESKFAVAARVRVLLAANRLDEAEQLLVALRESNPNYGVGWSLSGKVHQQRGDLPKAEQAYTTAIERRPNPAHDWLNRAWVRLAQQNLDGALADAAQVNKALPNFQPGWFTAGLAYFLKKDFAKAQEALDRSYQLADDHVPTLVLLGWSNLNLGNSGQAVERADRAVALAPNLVAPRMLMANLYLAQGQPRQAEETIRPVVAGLPDYLPAKGLLVSSLQAQGKGAEATPLLGQIAAASPESLDVQTAVGLELVRANEPQKALAMLRGAVEKAPRAPRANAALVTTLLHEKRFGEAIAAAEDFHQQDPKDVNGLRLLAEAQLAAGQDDKAAATFRQVLDLSPGDPAAAVRLAEHLTRDSDLAGARKVLEGASARFPDDAGLMAVLSQVAMREGRPEEAKALLRKAIEKDPSHQAARLLLGEQLLAERDPKGALAVLPAEPSSGDARVLALRARAYLELKDYANARSDLERLRAAQPTSAIVQFQLANVYGALGDIDRMHKSLDVAARLAPGDTAIGLAHARSLAIRGNLTEAAAVLGRLGLPATDVALLDTRLLIAEKKGDRAERLRLAEGLFKADPSALTVLRLAQAQVAAGQQEAAEHALRGWIEQHPGDDTVAFTLADTYGRSARPDQAVALLRALVVKHPDNALLLNNLAWYLQESAPAEALSVAEKAYRAAPDHFAIIDTYAMLLVRNGKSEQALAVVDRAIAKANEPSYLKLVRVEVLARSGDVAKATTEFAAVSEAGIPAALRAKADALEKAIQGAR